MSTTWSFYSTKSGEFLGQTFTGLPEDIAQNTPEGCVAYVGQVNKNKFKIDLSTGNLVAWVPPKPEDTLTHTHTWNAQKEVWVRVQQPAQVAAVAGGNIREVRDTLLMKSDIAVLKALEMGRPVPVAWTNYRQALRDISLQPGFPLNVDWPNTPGNT